MEDAKRKQIAPVHVHQYVPIDAPGIDPPSDAFHLATPSAVHKARTCHRRDDPSRCPSHFRRWFWPSNDGTLFCKKERTSDVDCTVGVGANGPEALLIQAGPINLDGCFAPNRDVGRVKILKDDGPTLFYGPFILHGPTYFNLGAWGTKCNCVLGGNIGRETFWYTIPHPFPMHFFADLIWKKYIDIKLIIIISKHLRRRNSFGRNPFENPISSDDENTICGDEKPISADGLVQHTEIWQTEKPPFCFSDYIYGYKVKFLRWFFYKLFCSLKTSSLFLRR